MCNYFKENIHTSPSKLLTGKMFFTPAPQNTKIKKTEIPSNVLREAEQLAARRRVRQMPDNPAVALGVCSGDGRTRVERGAVALLIVAQPWKQIVDRKLEVHPLKGKLLSITKG